jgi:hypothetical protein
VLPDGRPLFGFADGLALSSQWTRKMTMRDKCTCPYCTIADALDNLCKADHLLSAHIAGETDDDCAADRALARLRVSGDQLADCLQAKNDADAAQPDDTVVRH